MGAELLDLLKIECKVGPVLKEDGKYIIKDFRMMGLDLELMPSNWNDFTVRFNRFKFFDLDAFEKHVRYLFYSRLKIDQVNFQINSHRIYVYISDKKSINEKHAVLKLVFTEIEKILDSILDAIKINDEKIL